MALRRRLAGVERVSISQERQTAEVALGPGLRAFSPSEFRAAVEEAGVEVTSFEIDACGRLERDDGKGWCVAGPNRFLVADGSLTDAHATCVSAVLDDASEPDQLVAIRLIKELVAPVSSQIRNRPSSATAY